MTKHRVFVIAPTRSTCENIEMVLKNPYIPTTLLERECGPRIDAAVDRLSEGGFGIMAGTGTGKTVAIKKIAGRVLRETLRVSVVTREHAVSAETHRANIVVITPGIALNWLKRGFILPTDLIVIDEIHQTGNHLELAAAIAKKRNHTFIWLSATVEGGVFARYLNSRVIIRCNAFDPARAARVSTAPEGTLLPHLDMHLDRYCQEKRGIAVFVATRAQAEQYADKYSRSGLTSMFYHAGEKVSKLKPLLEGTIERPYLVFMTSAGSSSLNIQGLDTVLIADEQIREVVVNGRRLRKNTEIDNNTLLQMIGRVHGRALSGEVVVFTNRTIDLAVLKPTLPEFQLGADLPHLVLTCASLGYTTEQLEFLPDIDHLECEKFFENYRIRGLIEEDRLELSAYGHEVNSLPIPPEWGEVVATAFREELFKPIRKIAVVVAACGLLYSFARGNTPAKEHRLRGSDHLTIYNIVTSALREAASTDWGDGGYYIDYRKLRPWCEVKGYESKPITEAALAIRSIADALGEGIPDPEEFSPIEEGDERIMLFERLLLKTNSLNMVSAHAWWEQRIMEARGSMVGKGDIVCGTVSHWEDKQGQERTSVEGTALSGNALKQHAEYSIHSLHGVSENGRTFSAHAEFTLAGKHLGSAEADFRPEELPLGMRAQCPQLLATWLLAKITEP